MNFRQLKTIFLLILACFIFYFIVIAQINNNLLGLQKEQTELEENYKIIESESNSIKAEIEALLSMKNLEKIAKEKNFSKPTKEQVIYIKNDKDQKE